MPNLSTSEDSIHRNNSIVTGDFNSKNGENPSDNTPQKSKQRTIPSRPPPLIPINMVENLQSLQSESETKIRLNGRNHPYHDLSQDRNLSLISRHQEQRKRNQLVMNSTKQQLALRLQQKVERKENSFITPEGWQSSHSDSFFNGAKKSSTDMSTYSMFKSIVHRIRRSMAKKRNREVGYYPSQKKCKCDTKGDSPILKAILLGKMDSHQLLNLPLNCRESNASDHYRSDGESRSLGNKFENDKFDFLHHNGCYSGNLQSQNGRKFSECSESNNSDLQTSNNLPLQRDSRNSIQDVHYKTLALPQSGRDRSSNDVIDLALQSRKYSSKVSVVNDNKPECDNTAVKHHLHCTSNISLHPPSGMCHSIQQKVSEYPSTHNTSHIASGYHMSSKLTSKTSRSHSLHCKQTDGTYHHSINDSEQSAPKTSRSLSLPKESPSDQRFHYHHMSVQPFKGPPPLPLNGVLKSQPSSHLPPSGNIPSHHYLSPNSLRFHHSTHGGATEAILQQAGACIDPNIHGNMHSNLRNLFNTHLYDGSKPFYSSPEIHSKMHHISANKSDHIQPFCTVLQKHDSCKTTEQAQGKGDMNYSALQLTRAFNTYSSEYFNGNSLPTSPLYLGKKMY